MRGVPEPDDAVNRLLNQVFRRAGGSPLRPGNRVELLRDAAENYPAWLDAIASAGRTVHFESYIIHDDAAGRRFSEALSDKARDGVRVRLLYDWWGARGLTSRRFWRGLREAGVDVRCFNPPRPSSPMGWLRRDHRKTIAVDGRIAFVSGLCVGEAWQGDPARGVEPWRDTGVSLEGPAVADVVRAFAETWAAAGEPLPPDELPSADVSHAGDTSVLVVDTVPGAADLYRLDQMLAAAATRTLWLTDAYFVATTPYVSALRAAVNDGVDVRLLVPGATDIPGLRAISRAGYRSLLEAGIRVFEWNGPMLHAKTAVADRSWARVGSTNLNPASWIGNWELDVLVQDERFAQRMAEAYLTDLQSATEIVLNMRRHIARVANTSTSSPRRRQLGGSAGRATAGVIGIGSTIGAAISARRELGPAEARVLTGGGIVLLLLSLAVAVWPRVFTVPASIFGLWAAVVLLSNAYRLHRGRRPRGAVHKPE